MDRFPFSTGLVDDLRSCLDYGLALDPWLAGLKREYFEDDSQEALQHAAAQLAVERWREPPITEVLGDLPAAARLGRTACQEMLISSAAAIAHDRLGDIHVGPVIAHAAISRLRRFVADRGIGALVRVYAVVTYVENHGAVRHYGRVSEDDFVHGRLHRPWVEYELDDELLAGLLAGAYSLTVEDGRRYVLHTPLGEERYQQARRALVDSGYMERRLQLIFLSQFNLFENWDASAARMFPRAVEQRRAFTAFAAIPAGANMLECGCGTGSQTFEGGLWEATGPDGRIVGIDPAIGMLERAKTKARQHRAENLTFRQARAEHMPFFADGAFDATVGVGFLHFTQDVPRAVREMRRVTKPGGIVAVMAPCRFSFDLPWFRDWFAPVFDLAQRQGTTVRQVLHEPGEVGRRFVEAGLRDVRTVPSVVPWTAVDAETTVHHLLEGVSFFQSEMELLPWAAREEMLAELRGRGERVCRQSSLEERTVQNPLDFVRGVVPG